MLIATYKKNVNIMWGTRILVTTAVGRARSAFQKFDQKKCFIPLRNVGATFGHCTVQNAKLYVATENAFAHQVLETSQKSYQLFRTPTQKNKDVAAAEPPPNVLSPRSDSASIEELYLDVCALLEYCSNTDTLISEPQFVEFISKFCEKSHKLSDDQLIDILTLMVRLPSEPSVKSANFVELWNTLDAECCQRLENWSTDRTLYVCDIWYALHLARISDFVNESIRRLGRKVRKMKPEQLVQMMFLCNVQRRQIYDMFDFEENLAKCVHEMSLQELGVMSMGFFKTQTPIRNPILLEHLYQRLMGELDTVDDIILVAILKVLRYSSRLPQVGLMTELMEKLCGQMNRISLLSCLHVALLGSDLQCCHDPLLDLISRRFLDGIEQTRLKDLERICFALSVFNFRSPNGLEHELFAQILAGMHARIEEIIKHPRCFPLCLHFLSIKGHYDMEMLSSVLDISFIRHAYGTNLSLARELYHLDGFVKINLRNSSYDGNQLSDKHRRTMGRLFTNYIPERNPKYKLNTTDRILLEIKETLDRLFRKQVTLKHILPHFERPDIVLCIDRNIRQAIPLSDTCPEDYSGVILTRKELLDHRDAPHVDTIAIVAEGWNNVVRDKQRNTGLFDLKLQQLKLLNHKFITVNWHQWRELETESDRQDFLKRRLASVTSL